MIPFDNESFIATTLVTWLVSHQHLIQGIWENIPLPTLGIPKRIFKILRNKGQITKY